MGRPKKLTKSRITELSSEELSRAIILGQITFKEYRKAMNLIFTEDRKRRIK